MDGLSISQSSQFLQSGKIDSVTSSGSALTPGQGAATDGAKSFSDTLKDAIQNVNETQKSSDKAMQSLATGKTENVADVMITAEKADIALRLMMQVRNKMIEAYQDVMKMQV